MLYIFLLLHELLFFRHYASCSMIGDTMIIIPFLKFIVSWLVETGTQICCIHSRYGRHHKRGTSIKVGAKCKKDLTNKRAFVEHLET